MRILQLIVSFSLAAAVLSAQNIVSETRSALNKWVETEQLISEERSDWKVEQSILGDTVALLTDELARLEGALEDLDASATAADEERTQLAAEKESLNAASSVVKASIGALEAQTREIVRSLPDPLTERIKPLIRRLPENSNKTALSLGERVQNVVGILSQADKFNATLTETSESREISEGKVVEVRTLYWGLAMAYYVDSSGDYAGIGVPAADGWEWPRIEGAGPAIKALMDVYSGSGDIEFVEVPAQIN